MTDRIRPPVPVAGESLDDPPKLSGNSYVVMRLREHGEDKSKDFRAKIVSANNCVHLHTACPKCAELWMIDYFVFFDRTAGGRKLARAAGIKID